MRTIEISVENFRATLDHCVAASPGSAAALPCWGSATAPSRRLPLASRATRRCGRCWPMPYQVIRLGAYWNQIEPEPGTFDPGELDWQVEATERAGKQISLSWVL